MRQVIVPLVALSHVLRFLRSAEGCLRVARSGCFLTTGLKPSVSTVKLMG